jgi:hypothetical protein
LLDEEGIDDAYELDGVGYYAGVKLRF